MIAKLIVSAEDRERCIERSKRALEHYQVEGVHTTIPFHRLMLTDEVFVEGRHTTKYLDEELDKERVADAVERWGSEPASGGKKATGTHEVAVEIDGKRFDVVLEDLPKGVGSGAASDAGAGGGDGAGASAGSASSSGGSGGAASGDDEAAKMKDGAIAADMQGTILSVDVAEGDEIAAGDVICVLEAMKMENDVTAPRGGTVASVGVAAGDTVDMGDTLIVLE